MNDVRKMIYGSLIGFFLVLGVWFSIVYIASCGFTFTCNRGDPLVERTPIPTMIPVSHSGSLLVMGPTDFDRCRTTAMDLIGAWVSAGASEADAFPFVDDNGQSCTGTYADVQSLFVENNLWRADGIGCVSCHNADPTPRSGGLDMTTYAALSKSGIVEDGDWKTSRLYRVLNQGLVPQGHSPDTAASNPLVFAGSVVPEAEATPTP